MSLMHFYYDTHAVSGRITDRNKAGGVLVDGSDGWFYVRNGNQVSRYLRRPMAMDALHKAYDSLYKGLSKDGKACNIARPRGMDDATWNKLAADLARYYARDGGEGSGRQPLRYECHGAPTHRN